MADITYTFPAAVIARAKTAVAAKTGESESNAATKEYFRQVIIDEIVRLEGFVRDEALAATIKAQSDANSVVETDGVAELDSIT